MGYTTVFRGTFTFEGKRQLSEAQRKYLHALSTTRRMKREKRRVAQLPDPMREAVGLPGKNPVCSLWLHTVSIIDVPRRFFPAWRANACA